MSIFLTSSRFLTYFSNVIRGTYALKNEYTVDLFLTCFVFGLFLCCYWQFYLAHYLPHKIKFYSNLSFGLEFIKLNII